jgi:DNA-nicking Smr family endonuclease
MTGAPRCPGAEFDGETPDAMGVAGVSPSTRLRFVPPAAIAAAQRAAHHDQVKLKLDLHDVYNRGEEIEGALRAVIAEAVAKKAPLVEIIPGKGSGQLKKRVLRFLDQQEIKALYHRVEKDSHNFGRVFVHFRWK